MQFVNEVDEVATCQPQELAGVLAVTCARLQLQVRTQTNGRCLLRIICIIGLVYNGDRDRKRDSELYGADVIWSKAIPITSDCSFNSKFSCSFS